MSNRMLGFLVIIGCGLFGYLYINFIQVDKDSNLNSAIEQTDTLVVEKKIGIESLGKVVEMSPVDKISYLKRKNSSYAIFNFEDEREFYFQENNGSLDLYRGDDTKIGNFKSVRASQITLLPVYGELNHIVVRIGDEQFLLNTSSLKISVIDMTIPIVYAKAGLSDFKFLFVTDKGSFEFESFDGTLDYFSYFKDFVYIDSYYIGIIHQDEKVKLKNLGLDADGQNLIVKYDPQTKEKEILFRTDLDIVKIIYEDPDVILVDMESEKYRLENFR